MSSEETRIRLLRHARIRRAKQLLKWLPRKSNIARYPILKWFAGAARRRPYLWTFKTANCTPSFYAGAIIAFLPLYGIQLPLAFGAAVLLRANLPIACGLQIVTNPLTLIPLYFFTYKIGRSIIDFFSYGEGLNRVATEFNALIIGGIIVGTLAGAILDLLYRLSAYEARKLKLVPVKKPKISPQPAAAVEPESAAKAATDDPFAR